MKTYKAVIVGLTGIGARRPDEPVGQPLYGSMPRSHTAAYYRHPQTEVVGVCDIRLEALTDFEQVWSDVWPEVRTYTDYRKMLETEQPDLVSVATPDHLHADITVDAAQMGAMAILCEKPIATSLEDADRMIAAAERHNVLLSIEHTRRWSPLYQKAREILRSGELGSLRGLTVGMYSPRSMLFRNGTHMVDMLRFFAESKPSWVFAELEQGFEHFTEYKSDGGHDPATDPAVSAYIHFENGVRAFFDSLKLELFGSHYQLTCDTGMIDISDRGIEIVRAPAHYERSRTNVHVDDYMYTFQLGAVAELVDVLENGGELVSPASEARDALEIMLAMLRSHELGNVRVDLPLKK